MTLLDDIRSVLAAECGIDPQHVGPTTHLISDLSIDSLDLLNAAHRMERYFGVTIPMEEWLREEYDEDTPLESPFLVSRICLYIEQQTRGEGS